MPLASACVSIDSAPMIARRRGTARDGCVRAHDRGRRQGARVRSAARIGPTLARALGMTSAPMAALVGLCEGGAPAPLSEATEDERSIALVAGIASWLKLQTARSADARRQKFDSFPGGRLGNSQGLRNQLRSMLGALLLPPSPCPGRLSPADGTARPTC